MKLSYYGIIYKAAEGGYCAHIAGVSEWCAEGDTVEETVAELESATAAAAAVMLQQGETLPAAIGCEAAVEEGRRNADADAEYLCVVPITVYPLAPTVRTCISIPGDKLEAITDFARKAGTTRSALMADATLDYIRRQQALAK
jgi:predicted RNase H-like HicB family nuclease